MSDQTVLSFELLIVLSLAARCSAPVLWLFILAAKHSVVGTGFANKLGWVFFPLIRKKIGGLIREKKFFLLFLSLPFPLLLSEIL